MEHDRTYQAAIKFYEDDSPQRKVGVLCVYVHTYVCMYVHTCVCVCVCVCVAGCVFVL